jgi:hypothetical protein
MSTRQGVEVRKDWVNLVSNCFFTVNKVSESENDRHHKIKGISTKAGGLRCSQTRVGATHKDGVPMNTGLWSLTRSNVGWYQDWYHSEHMTEHLGFLSAYDWSFV